MPVQAAPTCAPIAVAVVHLSVPVPPATGHDDLAELAKEAGDLPLDSGDSSTVVARFSAVQRRLNRARHVPWTRTVRAPMRMYCAAMSGSVFGQAVVAGSVSKRVTTTTRFRLASCCFVSVVRCSGAAPDADTVPEVAIVIANGRMFPAMRPNSMRRSSAS